MKRVASIDIFRALTMLLMLWVNDYAGMAVIPHWMMHARTREDMPGLVKAMVFSFAVILVAELLGKIHIRLKI